jgi:hypothetical protein
LGYGPLATGLRLLPWTVTPMIVASLTGALADRIGTGPLLVTGLALQAGGLAWFATIASAAGVNKMHSGVGTLQMSTARS